MEEWTDISGIDNYQVSPEGNVRWRHGSVLSPYLSTQGYYMVGLRIDGKTVTRYIHRLVAQAFIDNPLNLRRVCHINKLNKDNSVKNLKWI